MDPATANPAEAKAVESALPVEASTAPADKASTAPAANGDQASESQAAATDPSDHKKCFVGGLNHATDEAGIKTYFTKFGTVVDAVVMRDSMTRVSRGFGFITFASGEAYDACMAGGPHMIDGHKVEPKAAIKRNDSQNQKIPKRLFAGGLPQGITEEEFRGYFEQFGEVESIEIMYDRETKRMRGFGFVTFKGDDAAIKCNARQNHEIKGKFVELKGAETREQRIGNQQRGGYPMRGGRGGYMGGPPGFPPRGPPPSLTGARGGYGSAGYDQGYNAYGGNQGGYQGGYNGAPGGYNQGSNGGGYNSNQGGYNGGGHNGYNQAGHGGAPYQRNDRPAPLAGARPPQGRSSYDDQRAPPAHGGYGGYNSEPAPAAAPNQADPYGGYGGYGGQQAPPQPGAYDRGNAAYGAAAYDPTPKPVDARGAYDGYGAQPAQPDASAGYGGYGYDQGSQGYANRGAPPAQARPPARLAPQRNYNPY